MAGYILKRILRSICSIVIVVLIIMLLVFKLIDRNFIFIKDPMYTKLSGNAKDKFKYDHWEDYGYIEVEYYGEWLSDKLKKENKEDEYTSLYYLNPNKTGKDKRLNLENDYYEAFKKQYESQGYTISEFNQDKNKAEIKFVAAHKDRSIFLRLWEFFRDLVVIDTTNYVQISDEYIESHVTTDPETGVQTTTSSWLEQKSDGTWDIPRYIKFDYDVMSNTWCIKGSGTKHRYLLYFDDQFPFIHQNFVTLNFGYMYSSGEDFFSHFIKYQGASNESTMKTTTLPATYIDPKTGEEKHVQVTNNNNYHTYTFSEVTSEETIAEIGDYYASSGVLYSNGLSMVGYSFVIGIIATILEFLIGVPLGMLIALKKDSIWDKIGNLYIIFIMAVPSLAYIYIFATLGQSIFKLPTKWMPLGGAAQIPYFILPIVSLALPAVAGLMKWTRRYVIDQMTSDYVKFARSQGYSEGEIVRKFVLKNAIIPIAQSIPGSILGSLVGAIITERVYGVPGMGKLLTNAIDNYDNGVIVGISFFYALLSVISMILGDVLMAKMDPRISFSGGGRK